MRAELEEMEWIERYHQGELSPEEVKAFETRMAEDTALKQRVEAQAEVMDYFRISGLKAAVNNAHTRHLNAGAGANNLWWKSTKLWALVATVAVTVPLSLYILSGSNQELKTAITPQSASEQMTEGMVSGIAPAALKQEVIKQKPTRYRLNADRGGRVVDDRSGAVITLPPSALVHSDGTPVKGEVDLTYIEYRDQVDMALSGIPMTVKKNKEELRMNSSGMFEIRAYQNEEALHVKQGEEVEVLFHMTDSLPETSFWKLDEETQEWQEIRASIETEPRVKMAIGELHDAIADSSSVAVIEEEGLTPSDKGDGEKEEGAQRKEIFREGAGDFMDGRPAHEAVRVDGGAFERQQDELDYYSFQPRWSDKSDAVASMARALELAVQFADNPVEDPFEYYNDVDTSGLEHSYKNFSFAGTMPKEEAENIYRPVRLRLLNGSLEEEATLKFMYLRKDFPEMEPFEKLDWIYDGKNENVLSYDMLNKDWLDFRLELDTANQQYVLELKGDYRFEHIPLRPDYRKGYKEEEMFERMQKDFGLYRINLNERSTQEQQSQRQKHASKTSQFNIEVINLYDVAALYADTTEMKLGLESWKAHFRDSRDLQADRYRTFREEFRSAADQEKYIEELIRLLNEKLRAKGAKGSLGGRDLIAHFKEVWNNGGFPNIAPIGGRNNGRGMRQTPVDDGDRTSGTLLAEGINAGHTYPPLVRRLNVSDFGVYNCDQIYRLADLKSVNAIYMDENGDVIRTAHVLSVIDLSYNGAFSFAPNGFQFSASGKTALVLFTRDERVYYLSAEQFSEMGLEGGKQYTLTMQNMTDTFKTAEDLKRELGIGKNPA